MDTGMTCEASGASQMSPESKVSCSSHRCQDHAISVSSWVSSPDLVTQVPQTEQKTEKCFHICGVMTSLECVHTFPYGPGDGCHGYRHSFLQTVHCHPRHTYTHADMLTHTRARAHTHTLLSQRPVSLMSGLQSLSKAVPV